ncbi:AraC family transcriptional regulator [Streptococcus sp. S784/96/1]|uniref:AraC family transcriptional regulator n=1 Tax=Streptococcus sp. S784/96/1 TaxID=2653499 RepID=UPI001386B253|nr:AraC family transcriptional regulator [Streptococcus sp. S784/96/1]
MNLRELETYLHHINVIEQKQKESGKSINDFPMLNETEKLYLDPLFNIIRFPKNAFFKEGQNVFISRHNRFAPMIEHLHDFIEIIYVYAGQCRQKINGEEIDLPQGSLCVLDRDVPHSIEPLGEEDVLINILINEETFSSLFLLRMQNDTSLATSFLTTAFDKQARHDRYMIFDTSSNSRIHLQMQMLLSEYWSYQSQRETFLSHYLQLIFMELFRIYRDETFAHHTSQRFDYAKVLDYIDSHYQGLKISDLAQHFGYNSNYMSNMLKKHTGKNFQEILLEKRLLIACDLLSNTELSIDNIALESGFNTTSYFFRQFKKRYGCTPSAYRKNNV